MLSREARAILKRECRLEGDAHLCDEVGTLLPEIGFLKAPVFGFRENGENIRQAPFRSDGTIAVLESWIDLVFFALLIVRFIATLPGLCISPDTIEGFASVSRWIMFSRCFLCFYLRAVRAGYSPSC